MRALAEFIMRGRLQAGTIAIFGYVIPLLTPAAVALVTLRKGAVEGTLVLLLGLLPAILSLVFGDDSSVVVWITLLSLVVVYIPALVLRSTISLPLMIVVAIATSCLVSGSVLLFASEAVDIVVESFKSQLTAASVESPDAEQVVFSSLLSKAGISGVIAYIFAFNSITGVLFGRWLQSLLYNPGGFRDEFYALRLGVMASVICFLGCVFLRYLGDEYWWWSNLLAMPLLLVAIAIAHQFANTKGLATPWLVLFYLMVFMFMPIVMFIGFVDAWVNIRGRLHKAR